MGYRPLTLNLTPSPTLNPNPNPNSKPNPKPNPNPLIIYFINNDQETFSGCEERASSSSPLEMWDDVTIFDDAHAVTARRLSGNDGLNGADQWGER